MDTITFPEKVDKEAINALPVIQFEGKIHLITKVSEIDAVIPQIVKEPWIGFDTETRPAFRKGQQYPVSLLQLATQNEAFLFRLNKIGFPEALREILASETILKFGVAVRDDIKALQKIRRFQPGGFIELAQLANKLGIKNLGLRSLAAIWMGVRISKKMRLSNWQGETLSPPQMTYAATDAWICLEMFSALLNKGFSETELIDDEVRYLSK